MTLRCCTTRVSPDAVVRTRNALLSLVFFCCIGLMGPLQSAEAGGPRIVTVYNFVRNSDFRVPNSREFLYEATREEIRLMKEANLPATWALEYDALINPRYQKLFKEQLGAKDEIAGWLEIPQPLAEKAGLKWRGRHEWDPTANVGFSPGYTPRERRKLVDVYMADFKRVFGYYPRTVGSWYIDEVTLEYLARKYGIVASCICKDQVGTDGYTVWGGYWNQAYYPSRLNAYMPAQTRAKQIDVPVFRLLGSDPIYQYGRPRGMFTLEPVYPGAGGSATWVEWFMNNLIHQPALAFGFAQVGQENSFGWAAMKTGLTLQAALLAKEAKAGEIQLMTLAQAGAWFHRHFSLTPATAVVCLDDWRHQNRKSVWYDSRFYRLNLLWENGGFFIRDLHRFDQNMVSPTHHEVLTTTSLAYGTEPIMDGALWSGTPHPGIWPVLLAAGAPPSPLTPHGPPVVKELNATDLSIRQGLSGGGEFSILCRESELAFSGEGGAGQPLTWAFDLVGGSQLKSAVRQVSANGIDFITHPVSADGSTGAGIRYRLKIAPGKGSCEQLNDGSIRLQPDSSGRLVLLLR